MKIIGNISIFIGRIFNKKLEFIQTTLLLIAIRSNYEKTTPTRANFDTINCPFE